MNNNSESIFNKWIWWLIPLSGLALCIYYANHLGFIFLLLSCIVTIVLAILVLFSKGKYFHIIIHCIAILAKKVCHGIPKWISWVVLTTLGMTIGTFVGILIIGALRPIFFSWYKLFGHVFYIEIYGNRTFALYGEGWIHMILVYGPLSAITAVFQWILLRKESIRLHKWIQLSVAGCLTSFIALRLIFSIARVPPIAILMYQSLYVIHSNSLFILGVILMCMMPGLFQWIEIRKIFQKSGLWIIGTMIGLFCGAIAVYEYYSVYEYNPCNTFTKSMVEWVSGYSFICHRFSQILLNLLSDSSFYSSLTNEMKYGFMFGLGYSIISGLCYAFMPRIKNYSQEILP